MLSGGKCMTNHFGQPAVVIGGSLAGLMAARVLADRFDAVTILERDRIEDQPALHQSIPQGHHLHTLLLGGQRVMSSLYPGLIEKLATLGAVRCRAGRDIVFYLPTGKAFSMTGTVREPRDLGFDITCHSRGLLEYCVRHCTLQHPNVTFAGESAVKGLVYKDGRVRGLRYTRSGVPRALSTDFVVDASGRRSLTPRWLTELGFQPPEAATIGVDMAYASTKFRVPEGYNEPERLLVVMGPPPEFPNAGIMEIIEDQTWHVTLAGRFGHYPPDDASGFLAFARALHTPKLYDLINDAERVADITAYRFPTSVRRHYERLTTFPEGLVVLGDAISSFNPVYGQGMSSAALQAEAFQQVLAGREAGRKGLDGLALDFFPQAAEIIETPWNLAAGRDFAYAETQGQRPTDLEESSRYFADVDALTAQDLEVQRLVVEVLNLAKPLSALREEPLRSRVEAHKRRHQSKSVGAAGVRRSAYLDSLHTVRFPTTRRQEDIVACASCLGWVGTQAHVLLPSP
jgi:2-polyprenyl-6-methoxyphenol hydroxylase-like FAD-dependent oxidoreductase